MSIRFFFALASGLALICPAHSPAGDQAGQANNAIIVVEVTHPNANAQVVVDTVASPLEREIQGTEGLVRIESRSGNDGKYIAHLHFDSKTDLVAASKAVQERIALAVPVLPEAVKKNEVSVKVGKYDTDPKQVSFVVVDSKDRGWTELEKAANAVVKQIASGSTVTKLEAFTKTDKQFSININPEKFKSIGMSLGNLDDIMKALPINGQGGKIDLQAFKNLFGGDKLPLTEIIDFQQTGGPPVVYRVNQHQAIRITGEPASGKSAAEVVATCIAQARAEIERLNLPGITVEILTAK